MDQKRTVSYLILETERTCKCVFCQLRNSLKSNYVRRRESVLSNCMTSICHFVIFMHWYHTQSFFLERLTHKNRRKNVWKLELLAAGPDERTSVQFWKTRAMISQHMIGMVAWPARNKNRKNFQTLILMYLIFVYLLNFCKVELDKSIYFGHHILNENKFLII